MQLMYHAFLIKYAEIAIKGKNRYLFEDALVREIRRSLSRTGEGFRVEKEQGRIYVYCPDEYDYEETEVHWRRYSASLNSVP